MNKVILVSQESSEERIAVLENNVLEEFYIERPDALKLCGNVYKGVVSKNRFLKTLHKAEDSVDEYVGETAA